jgi:hypothetical protein
MKNSVGSALLIALLLFLFLPANPLRKLPMPTMTVDLRAPTATTTEKIHTINHQQSAMSHEL